MAQRAPKKKDHSGIRLEVLFLVEGQVQTQILGSHQEEEARTLLSRLGSSTSVFLDFHGVVDLLDVKQPLLRPGASAPMVLSFVGLHSDKRAEVRAHISQRILAGTLSHGVLVFERSRDSGIPFTKAWVIAQSIREHKNNQGPYYFADDGSDHILSVQKTKIRDMHCILISKEEQEAKAQLKELLDDIHRGRIPKTANKKPVFKKKHK